MKSIDLAPALRNRSLAAFDFKNCNETAFSDFPTAEDIFCIKVFLCTNPFRGMLRNFSSFQSNNEMGKYEKESENTVSERESKRERESRRTSIWSQQGRGRRVAKGNFKKSKKS